MFFFLRSHLLDYKFVGQCKQHWNFHTFLPLTKKTSSWLDELGMAETHWWNDYRQKNLFTNILCQKSKQWVCVVNQQMYKINCTIVQIEQRHKQVGLVPIWQLEMRIHVLIKPMQKSLNLIGYWQALLFRVVLEIAALNSWLSVRVGRQKVRFCGMERMESRINHS